MRKQVEDDDVSLQTQQHSRVVVLVFNQLVPAHYALKH